MPLPMGAPGAPTGEFPVPPVCGFAGGGGGCEMAPRLSRRKEVISIRLYVFFMGGVFEVGVGVRG